MIKPDILIVIEYNLNEPEKSVIKTNATPEGLEEVIETWLRNQMGQGADTSEPNRKEIYEIKIGLRLEDDTFGLESDTGNESLTCGLVRDVLGRLGELEVRGL